MTYYKVHKLAERQIMERHNPAYVVVCSEGEIIFVSAWSARYFTTPNGHPSSHLFDTVRHELRHDLRFALRETLETGEPASRQIVLSDDHSALSLAIVVEPLKDAEELFLVVFRLVGHMYGRQDESSNTSEAQAGEYASQSALRDMQERLHFTIEEYESTPQNLITSIEELHASKDEIPARNEECSGVSAGLNNNVYERTREHMDWCNLYDATGICSIFLDEYMLVRKFTSAAAALLELRETDIRRPLTELAIATKYPVLKQDVHHVYSTGDPITRWLSPSGSPDHCLVWSVPYIDEGAIIGVVVTFIDLTALLACEDQSSVLISEVAKDLLRLQQVEAADVWNAHFIAIFAHDLRKSLVAINSMLDLLHKGARTQSPDIIRHRLKSEIQAMLDLIDDVVELTPLNAGEARLRPQPFVPKNWRMQAGNLVRPAANCDRTQVDVQVRSMPMLFGEAAAQQDIQVDLITHAVKVTRSGDINVAPPEANNMVRAAQEEQDDPAAALAGLRVLIAEDNNTIRLSTRMMLSRNGMLPTGAEDGEIAVALAKEKEFDLILMDLQMPRLDGNAAADRIRHSGGPSAGAKIIAVTAQQPTEKASMLSKLTFDGCLQKPLQIAQLVELLQSSGPSLTALTSSYDFASDMLEQLREIDGGVLLARTLRDFSCEIERARTELAVLIGKRDITMASRLVHKLTGAGELLGARQLCVKLRKFEDLIHAGDIAALDDALDWIDDVMVKAGARVVNLAEESDHSAAVRARGL